MYKFDSNMAATMKYDGQQLVYMADRAIFAKEGWDKKYWYNEAIKILENMTAQLATYQQDQWYTEAEEAQALDEQAAWYDTSKELE